MGGIGLIFTSVLVKHILGSLGLSRPMTSTFGLIDTSNSPIERYNPPTADHPPDPPHYKALAKRLLYSYTVNL